MHCPKAVRQCTRGDPLPTAPRQSDSVQQELHCPLPPPGGVAVKLNNPHHPLPGTVRQ